MLKMTIGVIGCGTMGSGIVQICAQAGFKTWVKELSKELLESAQQKISKDLNHEVEKGNLSKEKRDVILSRIKWTTDFSEIKKCNFVIEAVIENMDVKKHLFEELGAIFTSETILASNTSSYSITELASVTRFPERVVGFHFFYPVPMMKLVEVVKTGVASKATIEESLKLAKALGKDPIMVPDKPGFVVNRLLIPIFWIRYVF